MNKIDKDRRFELILEIGCLICWINFNTGNFLVTNLPVQIHHLNSGGIHGNKRLGDEQSIGSCFWHHMGSFNGKPAPSGYAGIIWMQEKAVIHGPSWAQGSKVFRIEYPHDRDLLILQNRLIEESAT